MKTNGPRIGKQVFVFCVLALFLGFMAACETVSEKGAAIYHKASSYVDSAVGKDKGKQGNRSATKSGSSSASSKSASKSSSGKSSSASKSRNSAAVNVILKNNSSSTVTVELIDQYGGNFTAAIDSGMSQSHTLKNNSSVKVNGSTVHTVGTGDEGKEIAVAR